MKVIKSVSYSLEQCESVEECYAVFRRNDKADEYNRSDLSSVINGNDEKGYSVALANDISNIAKAKTLDEAFSTAIIASQMGGI